MAYAINPGPGSMTLADWAKDSYHNNVEYTLHEPQSNAIAFHTGGADSEEMIRVDKDGFYIRGVRVPADAQEALTVYNAFKQWLVWANLQQQRK